MAETYRINHRRHVAPRMSARDDADYDETVVTEDANPSITRAQVAVQYIVGLISGLLLIRFLLALFGANEANGFVDLIYTLTSPLVAPFRGIFGVEISSGEARFEIESLVASVVYILAGLGVIRLLDLFRKNPNLEEE